MAKSKEMFADPEPLDENEPELKEEMFQLQKCMGMSPHDFGAASQAEKEEYAAWLASTPMTRRTDSRQASSWLFELSISSNGSILRTGKAHGDLVRY